MFAVDIKKVDFGQSGKIQTVGAFLFIGFIPNNQLVPAGTNTDADGYVATDEKNETNMNGIFAIGDLRELFINRQ